MSGGGWIVFANGTVYIDVRIPFTHRVLCIDVGRYGGVGCRYKRRASGSHD